MVVRSLRLAASLTLVPAVFAACRQDTPDPVGVQTVRLAVLADGAHGGAPMSTQMTQEVTVQPPWTGDPDGTGTALLTINVGQGEVCWEVAVSNITLPASASHIHQADPGIRGGIVVGLVPPGANGSSAGCVSGQDKEVLRDILVNPGAYYVNVHNSVYPAGAVRGQLGG